MTKIFANGDFAFVSVKSGRAGAGCHADRGGYIGSPTDAVVETNQLLALLTTFSDEFILAFTVRPFFNNGTLAAVLAIVLTRLFILLLASISLEHERTFTLGLVFGVDVARSAFVAVIPAQPILAFRPVKTGLTHTVRALALPADFALTSVQTESVTAIRLAVGSLVSRIAVTFGPLGRVFLTRPAVETLEMSAGRAVGKTGFGPVGGQDFRSAFGTQTDEPIRHGNANLIGAASRLVFLFADFTAIVHISVLTVILHDD